VFETLVLLLSFLRVMHEGLGQLESRKGLTFFYSIHEIFVIILETNDLSTDDSNYILASLEG